MSNARKLDRPATRADLDALPEGTVGEIIDGVLYTQPRPRSRHAFAEGEIHMDLGAAFGRDRGGPGGWWILVEPGIELPSAPEISPDIAGWRKERMPELPDGPITVVPDWVCEILSTNRAYDLQIKRPFYARSGVPFMWLVDVEAKTVTASALENRRWVEVGVFGEGDHAARIPPFEAVEVDVGGWWA
ncbi:MAG: hypothetical protein NVS3B10_14500 [Polyangiales bacterium]